MITRDRISDINSTRPLACAAVDGDAALTWQDFEATASQLMAALVGRNYDRVAYLSENRLELLPLGSATASLRIPFVGLDYTASVEQMKHSLSLMQASALFCSNKHIAVAKEMSKQLKIELVSIEELLANRPCASHSLTTLPTRPFQSISFTSGTTSFPKLARRTGSFDAKRFVDLVDRFHFTKNDCFLAALPFYHVSVLGWARLFLHLGGKVALAPVEDIRALAEACWRHMVTALLVTPPTLERLLNVFEAIGVPPSLNFVITGGKHLPSNVQTQALSIFGSKFNQYYGTTETGINVIATSSDMLAWPRSVGRVMDGSSILIVDSKGKPLPEGEAGRIAISGYQVMDGYVGSAEDPFLAHQGQRYFLTADHGSLIGGRLFIAARSFTGSNGVPLYELEDVVRSIAGVRDAFAMDRDQLVSLYVAVEEGAIRAKVESTIRQRTRSIPGLRLFWVREITYSPSGKVRLASLDSSLIN